MEGLDVITSLAERYRRYLSLLEEARSAIERRDVRALARLEADCAAVLPDLQSHWALFEDLLDLERGLDSCAIPTLHWLKDLIQQARDQVAANEAALAQWMGEVGYGLGTLRTRRRALHMYGSFSAPPRRVLRMDA